MAPQLNVVEVRSFAGTKNHDELVLAAIERSLAGIRLDPDRDVQGFVIGQFASFGNFGHVPPVTAHVVDGARARDPARIAECANQELDIVRAGHFAGGKSKFGVLDASAAANALDLQVVGNVEESHGCATRSHEPVQIAFAAGVAAQEPMLIEYPQTAALADQRTVLPALIDLVVGVGRILLKIDLQLVDLGRAEPRKRDVEIFLGQKLGQIRQLDRQALSVPAGIFGDLIVCEGQRPLLRLGESQQLHRRYVPQTEKFGRPEASVSGDQSQSLIDQYGCAKTAGLDAVCDLADLRLRMSPGISRVGLNLLDRQQAVNTLQVAHRVLPRMWFGGRIGHPWSKKNSNNSAAERFRQTFRSTFSTLVTALILAGICFNEMKVTMPNSSGPSREAPVSDFRSRNAPARWLHNSTAQIMA